jgi:putative ABC transport system ATP-binding protein
MESTDIAVRTINLTKKYKRGNTEFEALSHLDLTVKQGDFVAIMGASGSGKSTALHLIAGLTRPTSGDVEIEGKRISKMSDREMTIFRRRRMGIVFQSYNLVPHLTTEENILFPLLADGRKIARDTLDKLRAFWDELELTEQLGQYPDSLSGGQQQRVALARALCAEPAALLADEPTGNLDWTSSQNICVTLDKLNKEEKRAILLVTHEPAVAVWANRIVVLRDGKIAGNFATSEFSDAAELAARYQELARAASERR